MGRSGVKAFQIERTVNANQKQTWCVRGTERRPVWLEQSGPSGERRRHPGGTYTGVIERLFPIFRRFGIFHNKLWRKDWTVNTHVSWEPIITRPDMCRGLCPPTDGRERCLPAPFLPAPNRKHANAQHEWDAHEACHSRTFEFPEAGGGCPPLRSPAPPMALQAPTCLGSIPLL